MPNYHRFRHLLAVLWIGTLPCASQVALQYGNTLPGSLDQCVDGPSGVYTFAAAKGDQVVIHVTETNDFGGICKGVATCAFDQCVQLRSDQGDQLGIACTPLKNNACSTHLRTQLGPVLIPRDGVYTVSVRDADNFGRGAYAISIQRSNSPVPSAALAASDTRLVTIATAGEIKAFTFTAPADAYVKADLKAQTTGISPRLALYGPDGEMVARPESGGIQEKLRQSGPHSLFIYNSNYLTGDSQLTFAVSAAPPPNTNQVISQMADGGGWRTSLMMVNLGSVSAPYSLRLWTDSGTPWSVGLDGPAEGTIPAGGLRAIGTLNRSSEVQQGWAELLAPNPVGLFGIFRSGSGQEATVIGASGQTRILLPFDNTQGLVTGIALVNTNPDRAAVVKITVRDEAGSTLGTANTAFLPRGHDAFSIIDRFPATAGKRGVAEFAMDTPDITGLGLRFAPNGAFTSIPMQPVP